MAITDKKTLGGKPRARLSEAAGDAKAWVIGRIKNNLQQAHCVEIKNEAGKKFPALVLTQDLMDKLQNACIVYQSTQAHSERKAQDELERLPAIRTKIHMRLRTLWEENAALYQNGEDHGKMLANGKEVSYMADQLQKLERTPQDYIEEDAMCQEEQINSCNEFLPDLCKAFEKANLLKSARKPDTPASPLIEARLAEILEAEYPSLKLPMAELSINGIPEDQAVEVTLDEARHRIPAVNVGAVYQQMLFSWKAVQALLAERERLEQGLREHELNVKKHQAIFNEYVIRLEAVGIDCPTGTDSSHIDDRFREYLDARRKVVNFSEDQEEARSDYGSCYTMNHPDEQELLEIYTDDANTLRAGLMLIGVDVEKLEDECDKQDKYKRMIQAHHEMTRWQAKHAKDLSEKKTEYVLHRSEKKIAKFQLRYLEARKFLEDLGQVIPSEEDLELPENVKSDLPKLGDGYGSDEDDEEWPNYDDDSVNMP